MPRAPSIRRRLLGLLLLALALTWSAAAVLTYFDAHREVDALLDAHLRQSARLLVAQAELDLDEIELDEDDDEYGTDVAFQVRRTDGDVLLRSAKAPAGPFAAGTRGFSDVTAGARDWRVYTMLGEDGATVVHFAEDHATRERIAGRIALRALGPMLAVLPVLGFAIWWTVGRSLRPLDRLGDDIARRGADELAPVSAGPLPAELQPLVRRLDELFLRIRDSLDSERRFTSHAAHELRTPIAALRAQAEVAAGARDPNVREAALAHCIEACDHMTRLVSQLLLLARADELSTLVHMRPCRLDAIAQSVLAVVAAEAGHANVALALDAPGEYTVRGDAALLEALVRNLIDNAVRHGSGETRVTLGADSRGIVLAVEDDGPGVPPEVMSQLGRRFYRASDARGTGSGLGLSIVARIAQLHQAMLRFQDGLHGRGLRVSVTFPR